MEPNLSVSSNGSGCCQVPKCCEPKCCDSFWQGILSCLRCCIPKCCQCQCMRQPSQNSTKVDDISTVNENNELLNRSNKSQSNIIELSHPSKEYPKDTKLILNNIAVQKGKISRNILYNIDQFATAVREQFIAEAKQYGLGPNDLTGNGKYKRFTDAYVAQVVCCLLSLEGFQKEISDSKSGDINDIKDYLPGGKGHTPLSLQQLGEYLGGNKSVEQSVAIKTLLTKKIPMVSENVLKAWAREFWQGCHPDVRRAPSGKDGMVNYYMKVTESTKGTVLAKISLAEWESRKTEYSNSSLYKCQICFRPKSFSKTEHLQAVYEPRSKVQQFIGGIVKNVFQRTVNSNSYYSDRQQHKQLYRSGYTGMYGDLRMGGTMDFNSLLLILSDNPKKLPEVVKALLNNAPQMINEVSGMVNNLHQAVQMAGEFGDGLKELGEICNPMLDQLRKLMGILNLYKQHLPSGFNAANFVKDVFTVLNSARQLLTLGYGMIKAAWNTGVSIDIKSFKLSSPILKNQEVKDETKDDSEFNEESSPLINTPNQRSSQLEPQTISQTMEQRLLQLYNAILKVKNASLGKELMNESDSGVFPLLLGLPELFLAMFGMKNESKNEPNESEIKLKQNKPQNQTYWEKTKNITHNVFTGSQFSFQRASSSWFKSGFISYALNFGRSSQEKIEITNTISQLEQQVNKLKNALNSYGKVNNVETGKLQLINDIKKTLDTLLSFIGGLITQVRSNQNKIDLCYDNLTEGMKSLQKTYKQFELAMSKTLSDDRNDLKDNKPLVNTALNTIDVISQEISPLMNHFDKQIRPQVMGDKKSKIQNFASREYATLDGVFQHLNNMFMMVGLDPLTQPMGHQMLPMSNMKPPVMSGIQFQNDSFSIDESKVDLKHKSPNENDILTQKMNGTTVIVSNTHNQNTIIKETESD